MVKIWSTCKFCVIAHEFLHGPGHFRTLIIIFDLRSIHLDILKQSIAAFPLLSHVRRRLRQKWCMGTLRLGGQGYRSSVHIQMLLLMLVLRKYTNCNQKLLIAPKSWRLCNEGDVTDFNLLWVNLLNRQEATWEGIVEKQSLGSWIDLSSSFGVIT